MYENYHSVNDKRSLNIFGAFPKIFAIIRPVFIIILFIKK